MPKTSFKITDNFGNLKDFVNKKIEFIYPVGNSLDMEYKYINDYGDKIPCDIDFISNGFDLFIKFDYINEEIQKDLEFYLKKYDCEIIN